MHSHYNPKKQLQIIHKPQILNTTSYTVRVTLEKKLTFNVRLIIFSTVLSN